ncbi:DNA polymerase III subunit gamma/tau [Peribacillus frigoritolerans]|uniref:DNA polymerase III subunit gamma/tau n=1 Tax=Peribacillus frigoritolerans TaxID=450367 RepID=UPI0021AA917E|nr:DNA polymerase III subunit gamma/tau [Peribacillus frigoritolerans]MCT4477255.1 DNA polymerase III subunit gamma/tau [Peribacillus frigoritolerans]
MSAIYTAYYDLMGMIGLIMLRNNKKHPAVPVFPLVRDICLMIYQINKEILDESIDLDPDIKKIRHRVKLFQKKNNLKTYQRIIDNHINQFGNDIDNLGFYLDGKQLVGSTIYTTYIFQDTQFFSNNPKETSNNIYNFLKLVGETVAITIEKLIEKSNHSLPIFDPPTFVYNDEKAYTEKDILNTQFFVKEPDQNVFLTRLVISLQEASTCNWLYKGIPDANSLQLDNYILLRLLSIKADEVMDNLKNMQTFLPEIFHQVDDECNLSFSKIISDFDKELRNECVQLRNMIHYDENERNFLDYVNNKFREDCNYINNLTYKLVIDYMEPLSKLISNYLKINDMRSMNDLEKIARRLFSLVKRNDFRES